MTIDAGLKPEGAAERSPIAGAGAPSGVDAGPKRYSVQRKMAVVARLLRGEPLDVVAREVNVSVAKLTEWRDRALAGAVRSVFDPRKPDGDGPSRCVKGHEQEYDEDPEPAGRSRAEHRRQPTRGEAEIVQDETRAATVLAIMPRGRPARSDRGTPSPTSRRPRQRWRAARRACPRQSFCRAQ